ncbi:UNVERIFIED_CONTAM: hypothetical protein GTU68_007422, partial [Idotea baltica]|nr:hypothetical protein [Idotea baltica]
NLERSDHYYKKKSPSHLACIQPNLDVTSVDVEKVISTKDVLVCDEEEDWVKVTGYEAVISKAVKRINGRVNCSFTEILRVDDSETKEGVTTTVTDIFILTTTDFYSVSCFAENGKTWKKVVVGVRNDQTLQLERGWHLVPGDAVKLNVLMLGFDSLSQISFMRTLPKTFRFLTQELKTNVLQGYNIVGDGTPQALIPILTGKTELELPETRKRMGKEAQFVNVFPFIWNDFRNNGYVTLFSEDQPHEGCFNYRLKGFDAPPTDHYMRPFYTHMFPTYHKHRNYCFSSTPRHKVFLKYLTDFFDVYETKPKFAFAFHSELSHNDQNLISIADDDILDTLKYLQKRGHLNQTVLVLFSDHGNRFSSTRSTQQGKQEERLPFFSVTL